MRIRGALALVCLLGVPSSSWAQEAPPYDPAVDVQLFDYAVGPKTYFSVDDASIAAHKQVAFDFMVTFLTDPFTVYNVDDEDDVIEGERTNVVESVFAGQIGAAYGLKDRYQIGVALPLVFSMAGEGIEPSTAQGAMEPLQITGLGDLRAEVKAHLWKQDAIRLGGAVGLTLPSSFGAGGSDYLGD